ncbi:hypothetical protein EZY14_009150 [Kordia sp. TARA_039_SRF]|nr:hypothetical protein EZY14_009150 [Kordia sp. TARA_039_SRF]
MNQIKEYIYEIITFFKVTIVTFLAYIEVPVNPVKVFVILILVDTAYSLLVCIRIGEKYSSKKMIFGILEKIMILGVPILIAYAAKGLMFEIDYKSLVLITLWVMIISQISSICTHTLSMIKGKRCKQHDFFEILILQIRRSMAKILLNQNEKI